MKELYKDTLNLVHASDTLKNTVKAMSPSAKRKSFKMRKISTIAAAACIFLISGNIFVQALPKPETIKHEIIIKHEPRFQISGFSNFVLKDPSYKPIGDIGYTFSDYVGSELLDATVTWENDKIYLKAASQKINITKDIMDKHCEGTITTDERTYHYTIEGYVYDYLLVFSFD